MKILIVEDNALSLEIIKTVVADIADVDIITASDGETLIKCFEESQVREIDMIITDLIMPGISGLEAVAQIRQMDREDAKSVPIIALSSFHADVEIVKAKEAGVNEFLCKPIARDTLSMLVGKYL